MNHLIDWLFLRVLITIQNKFEFKGHLQRFAKLISNQNLFCWFQSWSWTVMQKKMKMSFWRYFMQKNQHSDFQKIMLCQKSKTRLLNCLKQLNQFAVSMNAYHTHKKPHSSSQPWHIANLILEITLSMPSCNLTHPYKWTESYRCI